MPEPIPPLFGLPPAPPDVELPEPPRAVAGTAVAAVDALIGSGGWPPGVWMATAMLDRATGELVVGSRGAEPVYTASLSKLILVVDVLDRRRLEGLAVTESDSRLIQRALGPSDDGAMSGLWGRFDGPGLAQRMTDRLGLTATRAPRDPSQWGEMMTSAADLARVYQHLLDEMPAADRDVVIGSLASNPPVRGSDGFDQGFGLLAAGAGLPASAKQAWMCCHGQQFTLHSAGVVRWRAGVADRRRSAVRRRAALQAAPRRGVVGRDGSADPGRFDGRGPRSPADTAIVGPAGPAGCTSGTARESARCARLGVRGVRAAWCRPAGEGAGRLAGERRRVEPAARRTAAGAARAHRRLADVGAGVRWSRPLPGTGCAIRGGTRSEAAELAATGRHVVISTGTASGKSLGYQLPVLSALLEDRRATALYLAPTKALCADQLRAVDALGLPGIRAAGYDGDTPMVERDWVRAHGRWLFSNPDMLHRGILPRHAQVGDVPAPAALRGARRVPRLPRGVRLAGGAADQATAPGVRPLRRVADLRAGIGDRRGTCRVRLPADRSRRRCRDRRRLAAGGSHRGAVGTAAAGRAGRRERCAGPAVGRRGGRPDAGRPGRGRRPDAGLRALPARRRADRAGRPTLAGRRRRRARRSGVGVPGRLPAGGAAGAGACARRR